MSPELIDPPSAGRAPDPGLALDRPRHGGRARLRASAVAFWLVGLALSTPILMSLHFPAEDAPAHLYWTSVYRDLGHVGNAWSGKYQRNARWNAPNLAYFAVQYGLSGWLQPHLAQRVFLLLLVLAWVGSIHHLSIATHGRLTLGSFASLLLFHNWALYTGFFSFLFGIPAFVSGVATLVTLRARPGAGPDKHGRYLLLGVLTIIAYFAHLTTGVLLIGAVLMSAALEWRRSRTSALRLLATTAIPIILGISYVLTSPFGEGGPSWAFGSTVKRFFGFAFWRGFASPTPAFWLTLLVFAATCAALCVGGFRTWRRGELTPGARFIMVLAACLIAAYFIAPVRVGQGGFLNDRIHLALWAILLPALGTGLGRRTGRSIAALIALLLAWQIVTYSLRARRFGEQYAGLVQDATAIPPGSVIRYVQPYEASHFEGSFVAPFMDGGEFAYHCRCFLLEDSWDGAPFYWVTFKRAALRPADYNVWIFVRPRSASSGADRQRRPAVARLSLGFAPAAQYRAPDEPNAPELMQRTE